jgi:hypothetical protein
MPSPKVSYELINEAGLSCDVSGESNAKKHVQVDFPLCFIASLAGVLSCFVLYPKVWEADQ